MDRSKVKDVVTYVAVGIIVAAPLFYALGYTVAEHALQNAVSNAQMKYELAKKALETETRRVRELESEVMYLETTVKKLTEVLNTVYSSVSRVKKEGEYNGITVAAQSLYIVPKADFCIEVEMANGTDLQKTVEVWLAGEGVSEKKRKVTLYPRERRTVQVCGRVRNIAANASIMLNGERVLTTVVVLE